MLKVTIAHANISADPQVLDIDPATMVNGECFIGRSRHCGVVLPSPEVSRIHSSITAEGGQYYFTDLASLRGSRLNGKEVQVNQRYPLQHQDVIHIGEFILTIATSESRANGAVIVQPQPTPAIEPPLPVAPPYTPPPDARVCTPESLIPIDQMVWWTKGEIAVRCVAVISETHDVKTFRFVAEPPVLFNYKPGQFGTLKLNIDGKTVKRSYSISSTPSRPYALEFTVKRVPPPPDTPDAPRGLVSNWLHDNIKVGSQISVSGPSGKFTCYGNSSQKLLLLSAGSGITPMMAMSRWILDAALDCDVIFFHNARTLRDIIYWRELDLMAARNPNFHLEIAITRPEPNQARWGFTGRLDAAMLKQIAPDFMDRTVYVCGAPGFMKGAKALLEQLGFPMENYAEESFGGAPKKAKDKSTSTTAAPPVATPTPAAAPVATPAPAAPAPAPATLAPAAPAAPAAAAAGSSVVVFSKSGKEVTCDAADSILDIAEGEGIEIDSSCRSGVCGTCKVKKLEGEIKYDGDPDGLDDEEQEEGYILTCIGNPAGRVVIEA